MTAPQTLPPAPTGSARRHLLTGLAAAALVGGAHAVSTAETAEAVSRLDDPVLHLLRRATFGPTKALYDEVKEVGTKAWLEAQLKPSSVKDAEMDAFAKRFPRLSWRPWEVRENIAYDWGVMYDYLNLHVARNIWSTRQLLEVVADFWGDHFVIPAPSGGAVQACLHTWHRDVIRKHALGRFSDLLKATARHPAMLEVLDNADSRRSAPNENYGRELLELHTVGVGHFTEADVRQSALALTGLSIDSESLLYEFKPERRHVGSLKLLGWSHSNKSAEGGEAVAMSYLDHLARHPRTAERIARKLATRFVTDTPSTGLVDSLAAAYLRNDTNIAAVLRALFTGSAFAASAGKKTRRPYEDLVATLRILGHRPDAKGVRSLDEIRWFSKRMGHVPGGWSAPNGYPDVATAWQSASSTILRWNAHLGMTSGWMFPTMRQPDLAGWQGSTLPTTHGALVQRIADRLLLPGFTNAHRDAVCAFLEKRPTDALKPTDGAVSYRYTQLIALLLDSHGHTIR